MTSYRVISIAEYQPLPGVEAPKEQLFKVAFWHPDNTHRGVMITGLPDNYSEEWLQERIEDFVDNPLMMRITDVPASCSCGWQGTVGQCIADVDGRGNLGCPKCNQVITVIVARRQPKPGPSETKDATDKT